VPEVEGNAQLESPKTRSPSLFYIDSSQPKAVTPWLLENEELLLVNEKLNVVYMGMRLGRKHKHLEN